MKTSYQELLEHTEHDMPPDFETAVEDAVRGFEAHISATFEQFGHSTCSFQDMLAQYAVVERTLLSALHRFRAQMNDFAPVNRLPVEVLLLVFKQCQFANSGDAPTRASVVHPVITLSHACQRWRSAALNDPTLWTTVSARAHRELEDALPVILARSKVLPVDISIEWRMHSARHVRAGVLRTLDDHLNHTRSLHLHIRDEESAAWLDALTSPAPLLATFDVVRGDRLPEPLGGGGTSPTERNLFGGCAPRLRHVTLENAPLDVLDAPAVFRNVVDLSVSRHIISPQDVRALLASCPNVQDLSVAGFATASALARVPQPRHGGLWPCPALSRLSFTDVNPRAVDLVLPHLPLAHLALLDVVHSNAELFSVFELAPESVAALVQADDVRSVALRGAVHAYPPRAHWDVLVDVRSASRAFPLSRPQRHPALLRAIARAPALTVSAQMWPAFVDLLPDTATFAAHKLSLVIEEPAALADLCAAALRPLRFPALRRVAIIAKTRKSVPPADLGRLLEKMIVFRELRGCRLKKVTLKDIRHSGRVDDLYVLTQQVDV